MNKKLFWTLVSCLISILGFQNCSGKFSALNSSHSVVGEDAQLPGDGEPNDDELGLVDDLSGVLPKAGELIFENQFSSDLALNTDFEIMTSSPEWDAATRPRPGQVTQRDPIYEEGHYSSPQDALSMSTDGEISILEIHSMPAISIDSGMSPDDCNAAIMGLRNWSLNGGLVQRVDENGDRHFTFPGSLYGGKISAGSSQQSQGYWDAIDECRIYTGLLTSKKKWGPGHRIQMRFRASDIIRTGNIFLLRMLSPSAYSDESTETGLDMSMFELGSGKERNDPNFGSPRSWLNTAIRSSQNRISYFIDTTPSSPGTIYSNLEGFYEWQNTWNSYFKNWYENLDGRKAQTQISAELPAEIGGASGIFSGWYVLTMDWTTDSLDLYLQKENVNGEAFRYFSTTDPQLISQSCDQQLKIGNVISQTFAETEISLWYHVLSEDRLPDPKNIVSPQFPQGRSYNIYSKDVFELDWVRVFDIPGGSGNKICEN